MELKNVFIDAEKSLGNITFAGAGRESQQRINGGRHAVISRTYSLYSDVQRADNVEVIIPGKAGVKHFEYEEPVVLVNPRVEIEDKCEREFLFSPSSIVTRYMASKKSSECR